MSRVELALLDVNETLFGLDPVRARFTSAGLDPAQVPRWFATVLRDGFAAAAAGRFAAFPDLAAHHVEQLARAAGIADPSGAASHVIGGFDEVQARPDVAEGLERLADAGIRAATFTNGTTAVTRGFLDRSGLLDRVAAVLDVAGAGIWKPHRDAYGYAVTELGGEPARTAMVAVHPWDVQGAQAAGLVGAWLNRDGDAYPPYFPVPSVQADSFVAVADALAG